MSNRKHFAFTSVYVVSTVTLLPFVSTRSLSITPSLLRHQLLGSMLPLLVSPEDIYLDGQCPLASL